MSPLQALVKQGAELHAEMARLQDALKKVEEGIVAHALERPDEHERLADDEREGRRWLCPGPAGTVLPVVFTADKLKATIEADSDLANVLRAKLSPEKLAEFYKPASLLLRTEKDGKAFRAMAREKISSPLVAGWFLGMVTDRDKDGTPKSDIQVRWQDMGPEAEVRNPQPKKKVRAGRAAEKGDK